MRAADEQEWATLQAERDALWEGALSFRRKPVAVAPAFKNAPHPKSAFAHLPLRGMPTGRDPRVTTKRPVAKTPQPMRNMISATKPHPDSYGADLPLRGLDLESRKSMPAWPTTAQEKKVLAARPLVIIPDVYERVARGNTLATANKCTRCGKACSGIHRRADAVEQPMRAAILDNVNVTHRELAKANRPAVRLPAQTVQKTEQVERVAKVASGRPQAERDALRRAYIAWIKGRVRWSYESEQYLIKSAKGDLRPAPWGSVVASVFPDVHAFNSAAMAWQSPRNARTLATH